eukprot:TRINITY_DN1958_c0_g1_i2.p2 TRINITY_DN1958_c0_g1~~TRINITY_DN1958_c0_g1_i2.p2  ORF type:complete len:126 (+),score=2.61 TRINITY_DN1958_c0_g1_i2:524-901(+)
MVDLLSVSLCRLHGGITFMIEVFMSCNDAVAECLLVSVPIHWAFTNHKLTFLLAPVHGLAKCSTQDGARRLCPLPKLACVYTQLIMSMHTQYMHPLPSPPLHLDCTFLHCTYNKTGKLWLNKGLH